MGHPNIDNIVLKANSYLRKGKNEEAINAYKSFLLKFPHNIRARDGLKKIGVVMTPTFEKRLNNMLKDGNFAHVIDYTQKLIENFPENFVLWQFSGIANLRLNNLREAEYSFEHASKNAPTNPHTFYNLAYVKKLQQNYDQSLIFFKKAIDIKPDYFESYYEIAQIYKTLNKYDYAISNYKIVLSINPNHYYSYNNLSIIFKKQTKYEDSLNMIQKAIAIKPDSAVLYNNFGVILEKLERLEEAEKAYLKAISLNNKMPEAYNNLGSVFKKNNYYEQALDCFSLAIKLNPDLIEALENYGSCLVNCVFSQSKDEHKFAISKLLDQKNLVRPSSISRAIVSYLKCELDTKTTLKLFKSKKSLFNFEQLILDLNKNEILIKFLTMSNFPDLEFENVFTRIRSFILNEIEKTKLSDNTTHFLAVLSIQCHLNEYVFGETEIEKNKIKKLENKIKSFIDKNIQPDISLILCLACYRELNKYKWSHLISFPEQIYYLKKILIDNYHHEKKLEKQIVSVDEINNTISKEIKNQYEKNPYPRWENLRIYRDPLTISEFCKDIRLQIKDKNIYNKTSPKVLIAGCGTGQQSITSASLYKNSDILAIDLSLKSLSYAKRKTQELGFKNITYKQADILNIKNINQKFDIIECAGVIHHMEDPFKGWDALVSVLNPGGLIKIGLYSRIARKAIFETRSEINQSNNKLSFDDIKNFRQKIICSNKLHHKRMTQSFDFYSLSNFRDLLFNAQELHFSIPEIKKYIFKLGLDFCGFEIDQHLRERFEKTHHKKDLLYDLDKWHDFEVNNTNSFAGMYQFWCQKI